jgi:uncharacterized protein YjlB
MPVSSGPTEPLALMFGDDGSIPNNPRLPLLVYRGAIDLSLGPSAERVVESTFGANGWGDMWRNGIFPYVHYHSMIHEALGIARGRAKVRFGGAAGKVLELAPGDVAVLPAGTGHQRLWATPELASSAPIPSAEVTISAAAARPSTPGRLRPSRRCRCRIAIPCTARTAR